MQINEFIWSEIKQIVRSTNFDNTEKEKVLSFLSMFEEKTLNKNILNHLLAELKPFSNNLKYLFDVLNLLIEINDSEFNKELLSKTKKLLETHKQSDLLRFIWIKLKVLQFKHDEYLDTKYADFLQKVFTEHCPLTGKIDKFSEVTGIILKPKWEIWNSDIFEEPLRQIVSECKYRYEIKLILARMLFYNSKYDEAFTLLNNIAKSPLAINFKKRNVNKNVTFPDTEYFSYADYIDTIQTIAIIQSIKGEDEAAFKNADFVLNNLPDFNTPDKGMYQKIFYMDSYFIRMRYNLKNGNNNEIINDYNEVKKLTDISDWNKRYNDVAEYLDKLNKHRKKN